MTMKRDRNTGTSAGRLLLCICLLLVLQLPGTVLAAGGIRSGGASPERSDGPPIDIGLVTAQFSAELRCADPFTVRTPAGREITVEGGRYFISTDSGQVRIGKTRVPSGSLLVPAAGNSFFVNKQPYRGDLLVWLVDGDRNLTVVNRLPLERYVDAVLSAKSEPIWPDDAIRAQAVAVRSLAWYYRSHPESPLYAVRATEPEFFYGGVRGENDNVIEAASPTAGQVLYYDGHPAATYTCESSGGRTVSAAEALGRDIPYLVSVEDFDQDCPQFTWEKKIKVSTIRRLLAQNGYNMGPLVGYRISMLKDGNRHDRLPSGRIKNIFWQGEKGSASIDGEEFADMLALSSTYFEIYPLDDVPDKLSVSLENAWGMEVDRKEIPIRVEGRDTPIWRQVIPGYHVLSGGNDELLLFRGKGLGRGMGLSKWGAKGMADQAPEGASGYWKTILAHYYPGTYPVRLY